MANVRVNPQGILDKDTDLAFVRQGNYSDALNIRHRNTDGQNFTGIMPIKGNANAITQVNGVATTALTYPTSTESYRVYVDVTDIVNGNTVFHQGALTLSVGAIITPLTTYSYLSTTAALARTAITGHLNNLRGIYNALPGATAITFTFGALVSTDILGLKGYFIVTSNLNEFNLTVSNDIGTYAVIEKETEYIATSGTLSLIGSVQLDEELFVLAAGSVTNGDGTSQVSDVGVLYPDGAGYHYRTLIRSKQLRFNKERNAEMEVERLGSQINLYWTDNLNPLRYIELPYANRRTTNGLLISTGGTYQLANVGIESQLILPNASAYIEDIRVIHGGGSLSAGNKRYTGRFVTDDFTYGDFLYPTNPVNIYNADPSKPYQISGDDPTVLTSKGVEMVLKNIPQGIYTYFDLVAIEYKGDIFEPVLVQRFRIDENAVELKLAHSNRGQTNERLSTEELLAITSKFIAAKTIKLFSNRMTLSNLREEIDLDLEDWASSFTHSLETAQIPSVGLITSENLLSEGLDYQLGEYLNPLNTLQFTSYMINDTYRFGVQVQLKNTGKWSAPYWVDDIRFDTLANNVNSLDNRRTANNINTNLTDATSENVNIYYVTFGNINLNYLVGGVPVRNLITSIRFVRAERIPEVLTTGFISPGVKATINPYIYPYNPEVIFDPSTGDYVRLTFPRMFLAGNADTDVDKSNYLYFHSADQFYNNFELDYNDSTDSLKILGVPTFSDIIGLRTTQGGGGGISNAFSHYSETSGFFYTSPQEYYTIKGTGSTVTITDHKTFQPGEEYTIGDIIYNKDTANANRKCEVFKLSDTIYNKGYFTYAGATQEDYGTYYGQIFRDLGANLKYPINKRETVYHSTGHIRILKEGENGVILEDVYGGDVFNQKTHYLQKMPNFNFPNYGNGYGLSFYSQNVVNTQMFILQEHNNAKAGPGFSFPQYVSNQDVGTYYSLLGNALINFSTDTMAAGLANFLQQWLEVSNQNEYSTSYNYVDGSITENGYDNTSTYDGLKPVTIAYSAAKVIGSSKNGYRYFQPLNFSDLDLTNGEITHHEILNDNFYTFQERSVQRQYFRDASLINSQVGSSIVVGSGSILGAPGQELTSMGTSKKTSVIKGKNTNGKDTAYWYNDRLRKILRLAGDGVSVLSDKGLSSYLLNNGRFISNEFFPLSGRGINGIWNDKYSEAIFTFKYNDGSNKAFTLVFDEIKNGFVAFHSYTPNIYFRYDNTFFSPNPSVQNTIFIHDGGNNYTFYGTATEPFIELVMNLDPNMAKQFEAVQINSDLTPFGSVIKPVVFGTKRHVSYLDNADFEPREDFFYSTIKNDSTVGGVNDGDTSRLFGKWLKIKVSLASASSLQKLLNLIVKFRPMARLYNQ
jgi:hypothetical protein